MTPDQILALVQTTLGPAGVDQLRNLLTPPSAPAAVEPKLDLASHEILLVEMVRGFVKSQDDGKALVSLLGKLHRFVQSEVDKA